MKLKYKSMLVLVTILLLSSLTIGSSYSLWLSNSTQLGENTINIGCFNLTFEDSDAITLTNSYPIEHSVGRKLHPYTFTITNICDYTASFNVNLELLSSTTLSESDIRVMLNNGSSKLYSEYDEADAILSGDGTTLSDTSTNTSRKITSGVLWPNKSRTYSLRLWIDENASSSSMNKELHARVVTSSTPYVDKNPCTYDGELVQGAEYSDGTYTYRYMQEGANTSSVWKNIIEEGWGVKLTNRLATGEINTSTCTSINGKPIVSMANMFLNASGLTKIDVSSFDTSSVIRMNNMFSGAGYNATTFEIIGLNNFDTSNVIDMSSMFTSAGYNATTFEIIGLNNIDTSNVTNMSNMFNYSGYSATAFDIGDLSSWDTSSVTDMSSMFSRAGYNATTFEIIGLEKFDTSNVTDMSYMFNYSGYSATAFDIGDLSSWNTSNVTNMYYMFGSAGYNATAWNIGDLSNWDTSNVTTMSSMFSETGFNATAWNIGDLSSWDTSNVTNMSNMFNNAGRNTTTWNIGDLSSWDTSKVTNMDSMFFYAGYKTTSFNINMSNWNVSNVINMHWMFISAGQYAEYWSIGNLSNWDTSKVTTMSGMFSSAGAEATTWESIGTLDVYASDYPSIFSGCKNAKAVLNLYELSTSSGMSFFTNAATVPGAEIIVNYSSNVQYIDMIINTKSSNSNVIKGVQLD